MCLAVPMKIISVDGDLARVTAGGVSRDVNVMLLEDPKVGEYVLVHAGFAIDRLDENAALETLELLSKMAEMEPKK